jgi:pilus assembly protein Flp/PilA
MIYEPREKGQGLVEYALILVLVAIVVIVALGFLGNVANNTFNTIGNSIDNP